MNDSNEAGLAMSSPLSTVFGLVRNKSDKNLTFDRRAVMIGAVYTSSNYRTVFVLKALWLDTKKRFEIEILESLHSTLFYGFIFLN